MYRTLCVLALMTLQAGLGHSFSWDIVAATSNRINFYNEGNLTHSVGFLNNNIDWATYDSLNNRVLFINGTESVLSYDIATGKIQTLIDFQPSIRLEQFAYDPATSLLFAISDSFIMYAYIVKPGFKNRNEPNFVVFLDDFTWMRHLAVDSCRGYIYWIYDDVYIQRVRLNGSERDGIVSNNRLNRLALTIDPQSQKMYWIEHYDPNTYYIRSADLNGKHKTSLEYKSENYLPNLLTVSKDFIYWAKSNDKHFWQLPKNLPLGTGVKPKQIALNDKSTDSGYGFNHIAANYAIEEQTQGIPLCKALKRLLPNYSETYSDSLNVSTGGSLLRVNETKVSGESRVGRDTCDDSVCHNYCLQGNCSVSAEGQPKCRCNAGYSGVRCEVNVCQAYCLNDGVCSLSEQNNPVCQCTGGYQGERCDVPDFLIKCSQTVSMLKDILNADLTSLTEGKGVKSTCA